MNCISCSNSLFLVENIIFSSSFLPHWSCSTSANIYLKMTITSLKFFILLLMSLFQPQILMGSSQFSSFNSFTLYCSLWVSAIFVHLQLSSNWIFLSFGYHSSSIFSFMNSNFFYNIVHSILYSMSLSSLCIFSSIWITAVSQIFVRIR